MFGSRYFKGTIILFIFLLSSFFSGALPVDSCEESFLEEGKGKVSPQRQRKWLSYEEAKTLVQAQGIQSVRAFREWSQRARPWNFPSDPERVYKEDWPGWGEFLGTGNQPGSKKRKWRTYEEAKALIQAEGIDSEKAFIKWSKSGKRPSNFPSNPSRIYEEEWQGWGEFLGTGNRSNLKRDWMSYEKAKAYIQKKGIKTQEEFQEWSKSGARPSDFPSTPNKVYKAQWESWGEFLGTGNQHQKEWPSYEELKAFVQEQTLRSRGEFRNWRKTLDSSFRIPYAPDQVYAKEWEGWREFLGTVNQLREEWPSYEEVKAFVQKQALKNRIEFMKWRKTLDSSFRIPSTPAKVYAKEWEGWKEFLGTSWISYEEAQAYIQAQAIFTVAQFREWSKSGARPSDFPSNPSLVYVKEWKDWKIFLGTNRMSYKEAKAVVQAEGIQSVRAFREWSKSGARPRNFPSNPRTFYKEEWENWGEFLGTNWMSYEEAQAYIQKTGIRNSSQFLKWSASSARPRKFPSRPDRFYKTQWQGWRKFFKGEN